MNSLFIFTFIYLTIVLLSCLVYKWIAVDFYNTLLEAEAFAKKDDLANWKVIEVIENKKKEVNILKNTDWKIKLISNFLFFPIVLYNGHKEKKMYTYLVGYIDAKRELEKIAGK